MILAFARADRQDNRMIVPGFWSRHRCPVCGNKGVVRVRRIGGELLGFCRKSRHPYSLERVS